MRIIQAVVILGILAVVFFWWRLGVASDRMTGMKPYRMFTKCPICHKRRWWGCFDRYEDAGPYEP